MVVTTVVATWLVRGCHGGHPAGRAPPRSARRGVHPRRVGDRPRPAAAARRARSGNDARPVLPSPATQAILTELVVGEIVFQDGEVS